ncbi:SDR family NAD(P)-dependent oxidoreductase [Sphingopyxis witflariensis]|jgi:NAD(P)-dependent dehydrogenase (short-subunit alcohol dehydrogenase family)|uniref:Short-chain dehydrogenase n=1 Tax=Sphingopyxis witflariensis TaxID=173675 RepID=A0A246JNL1_9SPHN|nr:SDR family NAD(P)-dependent oxidoreductase [Sphingopyxis witflariensis]OWQ94238.1 short-chain dehydrogenase [Sphingopyxis witflariensis]
MTAAPKDASLLAGQSAIVTGASSGLGYRFAKTLAAAGAAVTVVGRRIERLEVLVAEIETAGGRAIAVAADVADPGQIVEAVDKAQAAFGPTGILINNAGIPDAQLATRMPLDLIDRVLDVNVRAPFLFAREVATRLIEARQHGRIVNIASIAAFVAPRQGAALYATSKAAVVRMSEALAIEWARFHINVNCIAPGSFDSEMMDGMRSRTGDAFIGTFPRKRLGLPEQLDSSLLYLVSPASEAVTGTILKVDDGQFLR